jgi:chloramphenicol O-acetyltransferase type A
MDGGYIDLESWKHREHFEYFRRFAQPFFGLCADVDVTTAWRRAHEPEGVSFLILSLHAAVRAADSVDAMRLRIRGDRVWRHDHVGISTTVLREDDTFGYARIGHAAELPRFAAAAGDALNDARATCGLPAPEAGDNVIYHSTLRWLRFTAFSNALPLGDSIPRVVFGKVTPVDGRMVMPVSVEVHHAVVHGLDVARFYDRLQQQLT